MSQPRGHSGLGQATEISRVPGKSETERCEEGGWTRGLDWHFHKKENCLRARMRWSRVKNPHQNPSVGRGTKVPGMSCVPLRS